MILGERVSIREGKIPVIIVATHGFQGDDENTAFIANHIRNSINAYAVINNGWERDDAVDYLLDKADCNNVLHCHEDVVKEEFLDPILRYTNRILKTHPEVFIYYIHGMSNKHRILANDPQLDAVIGYGAGSPNSFSCDPVKKDLFLQLLNISGINAYEGSKGGLMSGWARNNMNQLFRKWYPDPRVHSLQIEIVRDLRTPLDVAAITSEYIANAIDNALNSNLSTSSSTVFKSY